MNDDPSFDDEKQEEPAAPKRHGGSTKGRRYQIIVPREPGDELRRRFFRLLDSDMQLLRAYGKGNATHGVRKLIQIARDLEEARKR